MLVDRYSSFRKSVKEQNGYLKHPYKVLHNRLKTFFTVAIVHFRIKSVFSFSSSFMCTKDFSLMINLLFAHLENEYPLPTPCIHLHRPHNAYYSSTINHVKIYLIFNLKIYTFGLSQNLTASLLQLNIDFKKLMSSKTTE